jgi:hypothetical protein
VPFAVQAIVEGSDRTVCDAFSLRELTDLGPWGDWPSGTRCMVCNDLAPDD